MPEADENELRVNVELPAGTKIEITNEIAGRIESIIKREVPEMEHILVEVGGGGFMSGSTTHTAEFTVQLKSKAERKRSSQEMVNALRPKLTLQPGMMVRVRASSNNSMMRRMGPGQNVGERVSVEIRGHDMQVASDLAKRIKDVVESVPGITDAQISRREGMPEMLVTVDRAKAASLGVNASDIAATLETVVGGNRASQFREEGQEYDILVRLSEQQRADVGHLQNVTVLTPSGQAVPIGDMVKMRRREGPVSIERQDQERLVQVAAGYANRDLGSIMRDVDRQLSGMTMPAGLGLLTLTIFVLARFVTFGLTTFTLTTGGVLTTSGLSTTVSVGAFGVTGSMGSFGVTGTVGVGSVGVVSVGVVSVGVVSVGVVSVGVVSTGAQ